MKKPAKVRVERCAYCAQPLQGTVYFCREHFFAAPAAERVALYNMHRRGGDCAAKVQRICRLIREDREGGK